MGTDKNYAASIIKPIRKLALTAINTLFAF